MSYADKYATAAKAIEIVNAGKGRKLGSTQVGVLKGLIIHGNYPGGWYWDNHSTTVAVLETLAKRGLVDRTERTEQWGQHDAYTRVAVTYTPAAALMAQVAAKAGVR